MPIVEIFVLQIPRILIDGKPMLLPYKKAEALLCYMAIEKRATRDQVAALLWDTCDEATARKNLRHGLHTIRKNLGMELIIAPDRHNLELNPELTFAVDYDKFMEERDAALYGGEFLKGVYIKNAYPFEEWMTMKRSLLKDEYLRILYEEMMNCSQLTVTRAEVLFKAYIQEDPLDERVYEKLMTLYGEERLYYKGIQLYQQLTGLLNTELHVSPRGEIKELYRSFLHAWTEEGEKDGREQEEQGIDGRDPEMLYLRRAYRQFFAGTPQAIVLSGEGGVGKTYLVEYFLRGVSESAGLVLQAACLETEKNMSLQPWNTIMLQIQTYVKNHQILLDSEYLQAADYLFPMFQSSEVRGTAIGDTVISYSYRAAQNLLLKLFEELSRQIPIIIFFDNIQFMDEMSLDFFSRLTRNRTPSIMILGTCWNILSGGLKRILEPLFKEYQVQRLAILPFSREDVQRIMKRQLDKQEIEEQILDTVCEETGGNALFLNTFLECCKEQGLREGYVPSMNEVWKGRLEALEPKSRQVLELISACQAWADMGSLESILKRDELELLESLEELKEQGFLCERQEGERIQFYFCHGSMQKFVHYQMAPSKTRLFHKRLAEYIEGLPRYETNRYDRLIYHYSLCKNREKVLECKIMALTEYSYRFFELYPMHQGCEKKQIEESGGVLEYCRQLEEELLKLCQENSQRESYLRLHVHLMQATAQYCMPQGYYEEGNHCIQKALRSNRLAKGDSREKLRCLRFLIYQQLNRWDIGETRVYLENSLYIARVNNLEEDYAITCRLYGLYHSMTGDFKKAMELLEESLRFFTRVPLKSRVYALNIAACYNYIGEVFRKQKLFFQGVVYYEKAIGVCENSQCPGNPTFYSNLGRACLAMGEYGKSREAFYQADRLYGESFTMVGRSITKGYISLWEAEAGNKERTHRYLEAARKSAGQFASPYAKGLLALTEMLLLDYFPNVAKELLTESVEVYRRRAKNSLGSIPGAYEAECIEREGMILCQSSVWENCKIQ